MDKTKSIAMSRLAMAVTLTRAPIANDREAAAIDASPNVRR